MDKATFQLLVTKLDTNAITLKEAKHFCKRFGEVPKAHTKNKFIKMLAKQVY